MDQSSVREFECNYACMGHESSPAKSQMQDSVEKYFDKKLSLNARNSEPVEQIEGEKNVVR